MVDIKAKLEAISRSELPPQAKQIGALGAIMGASNEAIIQGMTGVLNAMETEKAERECPEADMPSDYTEMEKRLHEMLTESTGTHILDSGGAYGRSWQRNRKIHDFREQKELDVTVYDDGSLEFSLNLFHYLNSFLGITKESEDLDAEFVEFCNNPANADLGYLQCMEEFADKLKEEGRINGWTTCNSYNGESMLSQVIQGTYLDVKDAGYPDYIILQIHNGCDVRGGYTKPRIFKIGESDYMVMAPHDLTASCKCKEGEYSSDDMGYHWYSSQSNSRDNKYKLPQHWKARPKHKGAESWEYRLVCQKCKRQVEFGACLE